MLVGAATVFAKNTCGVGVVKVDECSVFFSQLMHFVKGANNAVHGEHTVGGDKDGAGTVSLGLGELSFQISHVVVGVAVASSLAKANTVDDGGVVEGVGDDSVFLFQQAFKETAIGVKAGAEENCIFHTKEVAKAFF